MRDAEDLAIEQTLHEIVGGDSPPDRTFQIAAAVIAAREGRRGDGGRAGGRARRSRAVWIGGLAGAVAGAAAAFFAVGTVWRADSPTPEILLRARSGVVSWRQSTHELHVAPPAVVAVVPRVGDRVASHPLQPARLRVDSFGTLELTAGTELEVLDMEWKQFGIGFGTGTITVGVLAGAVQWFAGDSVTSAAAGETAEFAMNRTADPMRASGERERELERDLEAAQRELVQLRQESQRVPVQSPEVVAKATEPTEEPVEEFRPLDDYPELRSLMENADWKGVAKSTLDLTRLTRDMFELLAAGESLPLEMEGELRRIEGIMHKYAAAIEEDPGIQGMSFETRVRHPIIGANWLAATLTAAKSPLSDEQRTGLANLSARYAKEHAQRRAEYREDVPDIERYLEEMELQDRFYAETRAHLTPQQIRLLYPDKFRGRSGASPIGEGSAAWHDWVQSPSFATKADFVDSMTGSWSRGMGLDATQRTGLRQIMRNWIDAYPDSLWGPKDQLSRYGYHDVDRVRQSARLQLKYFREMANSLQLTPEQREFLRKTHTIVVPYRK